MTTTPRGGEPRGRRRRIGRIAVGATAAAALISAVTISALDSRIDPPRAPLGPDPAAAVGRESARVHAGSTEVGGTRFPAPRDAVFVWSGSSGGGDGRRATPFRTLGRALERVADGGTIVLRGGEYHERVTVPEGRRVTIQAHPDEEVWLDGSIPVGGWSRSGSVWVAAWSVAFDSSPTYERGAPDGTEPGYRFVAPARPLAAHPDQVWLDGRPLRQVADPGPVAPGEFAVDAGAQQLMLGEDPTGREVRAAEFGRAITLEGDGSVVRGIGIRRYAPSVPSMGALVVDADRAVVRDVTVLDSSTTGVFATGSDVLLDRVTVARSGMIGVAANFADGLRATGLLLADNNTEGFEQAPVAGGMKITRSRDVRIEKSAIRDNAGHGIWLDQSVADTVIVASDVLGNAGHGVFVEISARVLLADLVVADNARIGVKINNTSEVELWASTVVRNGLGVAVHQDDRRASDPRVPGRDVRGPPDPGMTWIAGPVTIGDTVIGGPSDAPSPLDSAGGDGDCLICVQDYSGEFTGEQLGVTAIGVLLQRASADRPGRSVIWADGPRRPGLHPTLREFQATGSAADRAREMTAATIVDARFALTAEARTASRGLAVALPPPVARELGSARARLGAGTGLGY